MHKGIDMAKRLMWLPISRTAKDKIVRSNILPAALYGAEAAHVNKASLQRLRSAIARAVGPASHKRNVNLTFSFTMAQVWLKLAQVCSPCSLCSLDHHHHITTTTITSTPLHQS
jgi:hypothetical protein